MFPADALVVVESFDERLRVFLDTAQRRLGLRAAAVATLGAPDGRVQPTWLGAVADLPAPPILAVFQELLDGPAERPSDDPLLGTLGGPFVGHQLIVVPLKVVPSFARGADTVALLSCTGRPTQPDVDALRLALERGISADRRTRLAEVVFAAVEQAPDAIELTDREARLMYANPAWERFFGYDRTEVVGSTVGRLFRDPVQPLHDPAFYQFTLNALRAGLPWLGTLACRTGDGGRVFCEVNVSPVSVPEFRGHFAVRRDTRHRVERDEALAIAHREFRSVLAVVPDGVTVLRDGRIYYANAAFLAMVRHDEAYVIGRRYLDFVHPDDQHRFSRESSTEVSRVRMVPREGPLRIAETSTAGSVSFEGVPATILLSRDTTDHALAQEQLSRAEKLSALGSLAAGVAHEINNPLAYVILNLELLREREASFDVGAVEALQAGIDGAKRIHRLVTELRGFSGSDGPGPPEPIDVTRAVSSALNIAQNEVRHRARLVREHEDGVFVLAREGQLVQVLVNVLVNAAQAIPEVGGGDHVIRVTSRLVVDQVEIAVSDSGVGIPDDVLRRLFDPFSTTKRRGQGSGLGLAISKRIVDGFGGRILVDSEVGRGTTVTVVLPCAAPPPTRTATLDPSRERVRSGGPRARVLIVDDEQSIVRALTRVLSHHDVVTAHDGRTALALMSRGTPFDVILCDLMMPGMPGSELYEQVCAIRPELGPRFVFMTGGAFTTAGSAFLDTLGARVLVKPFDPSEVLRWVAEAADQAAARDEAER